jgi:ribonuclease HII
VQLRNVIHLGIDENGVGPRLGPMVVTAIAATAEDPDSLLRPLVGSLGSRVGDSKALVAFGHNALGEAWARAVACHLHLPAATPAELLESLFGESPSGARYSETLQAPCPANAAAQCWTPEADAFTCGATAVETALADIKALAKRGIVLRAAMVTKVCTGLLNQAQERGQSRFLLDLWAMERLYERTWERFQIPVRAISGKVGGYMFYAPHFRSLRNVTTLSQERSRSSYQIGATGQIDFVQDADAQFPLVSLASLIGKWVRDTFMSRISYFHEDIDRTTGVRNPAVSGYHDPRTAAFATRTEKLRVANDFPNDCFERRKANRK